MLKRPHYIALGLVVVLTLVILNLPSKATTRLKLGMGSLFLPLFGLAGSSQQLAGEAANALVPRRELLRQNEALRRENQELRLQVSRAGDSARENDRLRQLFGWQRQQAWKLKLANVILRDPANWWRTVQIDRGSLDGVRTNMAVLTTDGALVGRVVSVGLTHSQVVLLGDPNCKVAARVESETPYTGVIGPSGPLDSEFVDLGYLSKNAALKPGQRVMTSGDGGVFPANILIGQVVDSHSVEYGLAEVARVKLAANLSALEEVWVKVE
jgi:rod shape-determining protein MreC